MITKLTKDELIQALNKNLMECSENEIRFVFDVFNLTLKEGHFHDNFGLRFEIHFKRTFIVRVVTNSSKTLSFENEYVNFGEGAHGIAMGKVETLAETLVVFINMFTPNLLQHAEYNINFEEEHSLFENLEEAQDYLKTIQDEAQKIINTNHPEPVSAPGQKPKEEN